MRSRPSGLLILISDDIRALQDIKESTAWQIAFKVARIFRFRSLSKCQGSASRHKSRTRSTLHRWPKKSGRSWSSRYTTRSRSHRTYKSSTGTKRAFMYHHA
uniref:Uncharacterized protein n=1 Tax=Rhipicephalus zambeziensis TaxID=60191 RepID=A0A224YGK1_9ACAR